MTGGSLAIRLELADLRQVLGSYEAKISRAELR